MHITRITSNIKGGVDQELGEKTLIVGPNGIGKSAIINAVELAVGGSASDIVGRAEVKREAELLTLAGGASVTADAEFSNGSRASYKATSNGRGGAKKAAHSCPVTAAFPVRDVRAALGGSSDTARSWLLSARMEARRSALTKRRWPQNRWCLIVLPLTSMQSLRSWY